ncbi:MAG TPA: cyclic nucleotide-binding domain-containing protein [Hyphomicrobiaceae bacterium]|nr:cyclic nucleotide-binding domain-containing protein [Hyphomicrobiaceae bacterium]
MIETPERALASVGLFKGLSREALATLTRRAVMREVPRGHVVVRQGEAADALHIVVSGRFDVTLEGRPRPIAEITAGSPIGEIAFLAGGTRTATVTAVRDGIVMTLGRADFDELLKTNPDAARIMMATVAGRLAAATATMAPRAAARPKTIAIITAGGRPVPMAFLQKLREVVDRRSRSLIVGSETVGRVLDGIRGDAEMTTALNAIEADYDFVVYLADPALTPWSEKAIRQADLVLRIADVRTSHGALECGENDLERFATRLHQSAGQRLVLVHETQSAVSGTRAWLQDRSVAQHHHVALDDAASFERLFRFIAGTARGLVACGGAAFCAAHIGIYQALGEAGVEIDMLGGTSGGAAMTAGFAAGFTPAAMSEAVRDIFVTNRAMRRYTWPRYSLLDHTHFDRMLERYYGRIDIEDLWLPYFAVSTNLSRYALHCHASGDLFHAVRASASIPALLPPLYTEDGQMLVDGCLLDNVPIRMMRELKSGPNIVVAFEVPELQRFKVDYARLPSRAELLKRAAMPWRREALPDAPGVASVLMRSLMANRQDFERHLKPDDLLIVPPLPDDMSILDWHRHGELVQSAYGWMRDEILRQRARGATALGGGASRLP